MWSAAIVFFIGTLLLIGLGIIDPIKDNRPDPVVITGIFTALVLSGLFAYGAEKLRIKLREKNQQTVQTIDNQSECSDSPKGVVLSGRLDTSLARTIFAKAIEAGYIEEVGSHYSWKGTKALLAYMCGRIYCGDYPEYSKYEQKTFWEFGNGLFPDVELNALFEQTGIGQSRQNRRERVNGILKSEWIDEECFESFQAAKERIDQIVILYNSLRPHASCDWLTPLEAELRTGKLKHHWGRKTVVRKAYVNLYQDNIF